MRESGGRQLREHSDKNNRQQRQFLDQLTDDQRAYYVQWFTTLPLRLDLRLAGGACLLA